MTSLSPIHDPVIAWFDALPENVPCDFNTPYELCNEVGQAETLQQVSERIAASASPIISNRPKVHIGFSSQFNYDIIAATHPTHALIADLNIQMMSYYRSLEQAIRVSENRQLCTERIINDILQPDQENFRLELTRPSSWLSTDQGYTFVRTMYLTDRIRHKCLDASSPNIELFANQAPQDVHIQTVYASNISEWLQNGGQEERDQFQKNMRALLQHGGYFIDAKYPTRERPGMGPPLRVHDVVPPDLIELPRQRRRPFTPIIWSEDTLLENSCL